MKILFFVYSILLFSIGLAAAQDNIPADLVFIKGGDFTMGSPTDEAWREKDELQRRISVSDFYLGKYEVMQKEYRELMMSNPSNTQGDNLPVENVTWFDAVRYCNARSAREGLAPAYSIKGNVVTWERTANGYRLPTEAKWEYACRAGTTTPFNTETSISTAEANYYGSYPYMIETYYFTPEELETKPGVYRQRTIQAGSLAANKWGLFDMHGNVWEWCWDWYGAYETAPEIDPPGALTGTLKVHRGGGWNDFAKHLRSAYRASASPDKGSFNIGFRLARNAR